MKDNEQILTPQRRLMQRSQSEWMTKITLTGWNEGFNKIQFNQFVRERGNYRLSEASKLVGSILKNKTD